MNKRHKHYEVIVAWAEGKEIQYYWGFQWCDWTEETCPGFTGTAEWRIKPEPKPDVVRKVFVTSSFNQGLLEFWIINSDVPNLIFHFDGETGKLKKAEVIDGSN